jgi:hypothetical protein
MIQRRSLHSCYNSIVHGAAAKRHRARSARTIDASSVLFASDPFADLPLAECSMPLCRQRGLTCSTGLREAA